ncbi:hypothetical protein P9112_012137 [Eukaryota sp. TZLM1-RC]
MAERFQHLEKLGEGTYGKVYKCLDVTNQKTVALKVINLTNDDEGIPSSAIREISLLKDIRHPNIVRLEDVLHCDRKLLLVFEYADTDLRKFLDQHDGVLHIDTIKLLMKQLLQGIETVHLNKILHRDLKTQNLLICHTNDQLCLKIADFGLARSYGIPVKSYSHEVVTLWYRSPELLCGALRYGPSIDMFSIGCIFAELVNGNALFPGKSVDSQLNLIFETLGTPTPDLWPGVTNLPKYSNEWPVRVGRPFHEICPRLDDKGLDLLKSMLHYDPSQRITATEALSHDFFKN